MNSISRIIFCTSLIVDRTLSLLSERLVILLWSTRPIIVTMNQQTTMIDIHVRCTDFECPRSLSVWMGNSVETQFWDKYNSQHGGLLDWHLIHSHRLTPVWKWLHNHERVDSMSSFLFISHFRHDEAFGCGPRPHFWDEESKYPFSYFENFLRNSLAVLKSNAAD